jgi:hypothetical protein
MALTPPPSDDFDAAEHARQHLKAKRPFWRLTKRKASFQPELLPDPTPALVVPSRSPSGSFQLPDIDIVDTPIHSGLHNELPQERYRWVSLYENQRGSVFDNGYKHDNLMLRLADLA